MGGFNNPFDLFEQVMLSTPFPCWPLGSSLCSTSSAGSALAHVAKYMPCRAPAMRRM